MALVYAFLWLPFLFLLCVLLGVIEGANEVASHLPSPGRWKRKLRRSVDTWE